MPLGESVGIAMASKLQGCCCFWQEDTCHRLPLPFHVCPLPSGALNGAPFCAQPQDEEPGKGPDADAGLRARRAGHAGRARDRDAAGALLQQLSCATAADPLGESQLQL